jgi:hypothetical protein
VLHRLARRVQQGLASGGSGSAYSSGGQAPLTSTWRAMAASWSAPAPIQQTQQCPTFRWIAGQRGACEQPAVQAPELRQRAAHPSLGEFVYVPRQQSVLADSMLRTPQYVPSRERAKAGPRREAVTTSSRLRRRPG